jgi:glutaminyl-peptide cyclotransferase
MRFVIIAAALATLACSSTTEARGVPEYTYDVVHVYPHDPFAFTEGLFYLNGFLYEGTGLEYHSDIRKVKLETGEILQKREIPGEYFGEGIIAWKDRLLEMTYKAEKGFIYDLATFAPKGEFKYPGQGWAFTTDGKYIYMDGTRDVHAEAGDSEIRVWDPETLQEIRRIAVTDEEGRPVPNLNELEWVKGEIYANIWQTDRIARIDPKTGKVVGWIDLTGLLRPADRTADTDVLNGIAYDAAGDRLFVTGKKWPKLFEIRLVKKSSSQ